uniref:Uncharacterized protein n=1 Tax=Anopheles melas TaxID=34690 RepID=A0A182TLJ8_9DIPT
MAAIYTLQDTAAVTSRRNCPLPKKYGGICGFCGTAASPKFVPGAGAPNIGNGCTGNCPPGKPGNGRLEGKPTPPPTGCWGGNPIAGRPPGTAPGNLPGMTGKGSRCTTTVGGRIGSNVIALGLVVTVLSAASRKLIAMSLERSCPLAGGDPGGASPTGRSWLALILGSLYRFNDTMMR